MCSLLASSPMGCRADRAAEPVERDRPMVALPLKRLLATMAEDQVAGPTSLVVAVAAVAAQVLPQRQTSAVLEAQALVQASPEARSRMAAAAERVD